MYPCGLAALLGRPGPSAAARAGGDLVSAEAAGKTALLHNGVCREESYDVASQNPGRGQLRRLKTGTLHFKDLKRGILAVWQH